MSNQQFEALIKETQSKVRESQSQIEGLTSRIEAARAKIGTAEADIDIENATLEDVHAHTEVMNANIAELIMGLDDVTSAFSKDFDEMRSKTGWESFVGIFSKGKSESMRQERMRTANIDDKLLSVRMVSVGDPRIDKASFFYTGYYFNRIGKDFFCSVNKSAGITRLSQCVSGNYTHRIRLKAFQAFSDHF